MASDPQAPAFDPIDAPCRVSDRFLTSLFAVLSRHGIPPSGLLGDLPIAVDDSGRVLEPVAWELVCELMRRLEHHMGGVEGLEVCGEWLCERSGSAPLRRLVAFAASPSALYGAVVHFAARRALPGVAIDLVAPERNRLRIGVHLPETLRACPQMLHLATGAARALPRLLDMPDAIVTARVEARAASFELKIPASRTGLARLLRLLRSVVSPGSLLQRLEDQQLELEARHARLARAHEALLARERDLLALSDAAVDTLCEIDASGRIVFVSASVRELMGYSREQVVDSHYRLWVPTPLHGLAKERFETLQKAPVGTAIVKQKIELHAAHGRRVTVEVSVRSHATPEGEWRAVACLRDATDEAWQRSSSRRVTRIVERVLAGDEDAPGSGPWLDPRKLAGPPREAAREAQSGTRSMSAPRARSFSSIRS